VTQEDAENDHRQEGLENRPENAENGLLVANRKIPTGKKVKEIAVMEDIGKLILESTPTGLDHHEIGRRSGSCGFVSHGTAKGVRTR
jgi:hypothetical protein